MIPECVHDDGAIYWNKYNDAYQCHKCGQIFAMVRKQPKYYEDTPQEFEYDRIGQLYSPIVYSGGQIKLLCIRMGDEKFSDLWPTGILLADLSEQCKQFVHLDATEEVVMLIKQLQAKQQEQT